MEIVFNFALNMLLRMSKWTAGIETERSTSIFGLCCWGKCTGIKYKIKKNIKEWNC